MKYGARFDFIVIHIKYLIIVGICNYKFKTNQQGHACSNNSYSLHYIVGQEKSDTDCIQPCSVHPVLLWKALW